MPCSGTTRRWPCRWTDHLRSLCDGLRLHGSPRRLQGGARRACWRWKAKLLQRADLVLTGGAQLYAAKRSGHPNVHCFPSSVDVGHFGTARASASEPADQTAIAHPRFGYCGVIDERMDLDLVAAAAARRPDWQFVMLGPVVKIDPADPPTGGQPPLPRDEDVRPAAGLSRRLGCRRSCRSPTTTRPVT